MVSSSCVNQRAVVLSCGRHRQEPSAVFLFPKMSCFVTWSRFQCESSSGSIVPLISKRCLSYFLSCILLCCDLLPVSTSLSLSLSLSLFVWLKPHSVGVTGCWAQNGVDSLANVHVGRAGFSLRSKTQRQSLHLNVIMHTPRCLHTSGRSERGGQRDKRVEKEMAEWQQGESETLLGQRREL